MTRLKTAALVCATVVAAMFLMAVRLPPDWPEWLRLLRPDWVLAVVFFWAAADPPRIGLLTAWGVGLLLDVLLSEPLGMHGVALAGGVFLVRRFEEKLRLFTLVQQTGVLLLTAVAMEAYRSLVRFALLDSPPSPLFALPALATALLLPLLAVTVRRWVAEKRFDGAGR